MKPTNLPEDVMLQSGGLLYVLCCGANFTEINVTMANGSRSDADRTAYASQLLRAVNSHDALVAALEDSLAIITGEMLRKGALIWAMETGLAALALAKESA